MLFNKEVYKEKKKKERIREMIAFFQIDLFLCNAFYFWACAFPSKFNGRPLALPCRVDVPSKVNDRPPFESALPYLTTRMRMSLLTHAINTVDVFYSSLTFYAC